MLTPGREVQAEWPGTQTPTVQYEPLVMRAGERTIALPERRQQDRGLA